MHARVVHARVDPAQMEEARTKLREEILPRIRQLPGVLAGYWLEPVDGEGLTVVLFDGKEAAEQPVPNAQPGDSPAPGVTIERIEIREVMATF